MSTLNKRSTESTCGLFLSFYFNFSVQWQIVHPDLWDKCWDKCFWLQFSLKKCNCICLYKFKWSFEGGLESRALFKFRHDLMLSVTKLFLTLFHGYPCGKSTSTYLFPLTSWTFTCTKMTKLQRKTLVKHLSQMFPNYNETAVVTIQTSDRIYWHKQLNVFTKQEEKQNQISTWWWWWQYTPKLGRHDNEILMSRNVLSPTYDTLLRTTLSKK